MLPEKIAFSNSEIKDLSDYLRVHCDKLWVEPYLVMLDQDLTREQVYGSLYTIFRDFYDLLYYTKLEDLPKNINSDYKVLVHWRLKHGK